MLTTTHRLAALTAVVALSACGGGADTGGSLISSSSGAELPQITTGSTNNTTTSRNPETNNSGTAAETDTGTANNTDTTAGANTGNGGNTQTPSNPDQTTNPPAPPAIPVNPFNCDAGAITCVEITSTDSAAQASVPVTFGQPFKAGDWKASTQGLIAKVDGVAVSVQTDETSSHRDGSTRFAVVSAQLSNLAAGQTKILNLYAGAKTTATPAVPANPDWNLEVETQVYDANGNVTATLVAKPQAQLVAQIAGSSGRRLSGAVATEYTVVTDFKDKTSGIRHPHLSARFHTRLVDGGARIRTDVVMENTRTWTAAPGNITYSMAIKRNGVTLHSQPKFTHYHHARWHKVVWSGSGSAPQMRVLHHMPYFMASKATWNYDMNLKVPDAELTNQAERLISQRQSQATLGPMANLSLNPYFPTTGGRPEIGPLPRWTAMYLVSQDERIRNVMLANADAAASVPIHYRDETTTQPLDVVTHPNISVVYGTSNPAIPKATDTTIWYPDTPHQGSYAYIPYLVTGDLFYLEETMFWAGWNIASLNPSYRQGNKGILTQQQVRAQAWAIRSIAEAGYAAADNHPLRGYFQTVLANNMSVYAQKYTNNPDVPSLGAILVSDEPNETGPWQNDFVGTVFSLLVENGEPNAHTTLAHISKFNVGRFNNDANGFCTAHAPGYYWKIRNSDGSFINTWSDFYAANYAADVGKACSSLSVTEGYPDETIGYAAYARGMLGAAANAGVTGAQAAYVKWKGMTSKMDAPLASDPTWAIVPRL